jgi:hypothetical protein
VPEPRHPRAWTDVGFVPEPRHPRAWTDVGFVPEPRHPRAWTDAGFVPEPRHPRAWTDAGFVPEPRHPRAWTDAGFVPEPRHPRAWTDVGFVPEPRHPRAWTDKPAFVNRSQTLAPRGVQRFRPCPPNISLKGFFKSILITRASLPAFPIFPHVAPPTLRPPWLRPGYRRPCGRIPAPFKKGGCAVFITTASPSRKTAARKNGPSLYAPTLRWAYSLPPSEGAFGATPHVHEGALPPPRPVSPARGSKEGGIPAANFLDNGARASLWRL